MKIGLIGAGFIGRVLARHYVANGHQVVAANSRGPETLGDFAAETGARAVTAREAALFGDVVIITIPQKAILDLHRELFAGLEKGPIVVDTGNYYPEARDGHIDAIDAGLLDSQWVEQQIGRPVIKAYNNIFAKSLDEKGQPAGSAGRIALSVAGDCVTAKKVVMQLIDEMGFDPVDAGDLDQSWRQHPGTPAYCQDLDRASLVTALAAADERKIAETRAEADAYAKRFLAGEIS